MIYDFFGPSPQVTVPSFCVLGSWPPFTFLKLRPNIAIIWPILQLTVWLRKLSEPSAPDSAAWMDPREHCSTHQRSPATLSWLVVSSTTSPWSMGWMFGPLQWQDPWNSPLKKSMSTWSPWTWRLTESVRSWCSLILANVKGGGEGKLSRRSCDKLSSSPPPTEFHHLAWLNMWTLVTNWHLVCVV